MSAAQAGRPVRCDGWTPARRLRFLAVLAACADVSLAARACGLSRQGAYRLRRRDPAFARQWDAACADLAAREQAELQAVVADLQARALRKIPDREIRPGHRQSINLVSTSRGRASLAGNERIR